MVDQMTPEDLKRIAAEKQEMARIKATWSEGNADTDFITPVDGRLSSLFGLIRRHAAQCDGYGLGGFCRNASRTVGSDSVLFAR